MKLTRRKRLLFALFGLILLILIPTLLSRQQKTSAGSATLYFGSPPTKLYLGQSFPIEVRLRARDTPADAVGLILKYDPHAFDVLAMSTDHSFCTFYTENSFDTIHGEVHLSCGIPPPGFTGDSTLLTLQMRSKRVGTQTIQFDPSQTNILADDGKGSHLSFSLPELIIPVVPST